MDIGTSNTMSFPLDALVALVQKHCNYDGDSPGLIRQRLWQTRRRWTYLVRYDTQERLVGFCDYDMSHDGIVHLRKIIALQPGVLASMVRELKTTLNWKQVYFYRSKYAKWKHHGKPWRLRHAMA